MAKLKPTPLLMFILFIGLILLAFSSLNFYSDYSYAVVINDTTGDPEIDSNGNIIYNVSDDQQTAREFYDYENEVIEDQNTQITLFWAAMLIIIVFAVFLSLKPVLSIIRTPRQPRRRRR